MFITFDARQLLQLITTRPLYCKNPKFKKQQLSRTLKLAMMETFLASAIK